MPRKQDQFRAEMAKLARASAQGVGGLKFTAQSPPGLGRLIRIPFYLETGVNRFSALNGSTDQQITDSLLAGAAIGSTTHPAIVVAAPVAQGQGPTALLRTPQISWALLRIVGFEVCLYSPPNEDSYPMELGVTDLKVGGGATLFVHEDWGPASIYQAYQPSLAGLRDYPILESPNQAEVQVSVVGDPTSHRLTFTASIVAEILSDDQVGQHIPGPYARSGGMVRQGGSFMHR